MDAYEVWTYRLTAALRALGIAIMVVILGWIVLALAASIVSSIDRGIFAALLIGYVAGRVHKFWQARRPMLRTFRSVEPVPPVSAPSPSLSAGPRHDPMAGTTSQNATVKAFVERETTTNDEALRRASDLTARQLQQALEIAEGKVGRERAASDGVLVGAVLEVLATNYRTAAR